MTKTIKATESQKHTLRYALRPENHGVLPSGYKFSDATLKACVTKGWLTRSKWGTYHITESGRLAAKLPRHPAPPPRTPAPQRRPGATGVMSLSISSLLSRLDSLTEGDEIDLFAREPARGLLAYPALAEYLAPAEYAAWSAANLDDVAAADSVEVYPYDRETGAARCRETGAALDAAIRAVPTLGATLREAVLTRCRLTSADPAPALALLDAEGL